VSPAGPAQLSAWKKLAKVVRTIAPVAVTTNQKTTGRRFLSGETLAMAADKGALAVSLSTVDAASVVLPPVPLVRAMTISLKEEIMKENAETVRSTVRASPFSASCATKT
jgi:hypothetical protein